MQPRYHVMVEQFSKGLPQDGQPMFKTYDAAYVNASPEEVSGHAIGGAFLFKAKLGKDTCFILVVDRATSSISHHAG